MLNQDLGTFFVCPSWDYKLIWSILLSHTLQMIYIVEAWTFSLIRSILETGGQDTREIQLLLLFLFFILLWVCSYAYVSCSILSSGSLLVHAWVCASFLPHVKCGCHGFSISPCHTSSNLLPNLFLVWFIHFSFTLQALDPYYAQGIIWILYRSCIIWSISKYVACLMHSVQFDITSSRSILHKNGISLPRVDL